MKLERQQCRDLQQIAITASQGYYELLQDLEAAHICHNSEALALLSTRLEAASHAVTPQSRSKKPGAPPALRQK